MEGYILQWMDKALVKDEIFKGKKHTYINDFCVKSTSFISHDQYLKDNLL